MLNDIFLVFGSMFLVVVGSILGYYARQTIARGQLGSIEQKITKATAEAETKAREIIIAAKDKAEKALEKLAEANKLAKPDLKDLGVEAQWGFHEWLDGKTGKISGGSSPYQAWTAGTYIWAYECLKQKNVLYFS